MAAWRPILIGERRVPGLPVTPDFLVCPDPQPQWWRRVAFRVLRRSLRLEQKLRHEKVSLVHAHFGYCAVDIVPTVRQLSVPLLTTFHGADITKLTGSPGTSHLIYKKMLDEVFRQSTFLIAVSDYIAQCLEEVGAPTRKI